MAAVGEAIGGMNTSLYTSGKHGTLAVFHLAGCTSGHFGKTGAPYCVLAVSSCLLISVGLREMIVTARGCCFPVNLPGCTSTSLVCLLAHAGAPVFQYSVCQCNLAVDSGAVIGANK